MSVDTHLAFDWFFVSVVGSSPLLLPWKVSHTDVRLVYEFDLVSIVATSPKFEFTPASSLPLRAITLLICTSRFT